MSRTSPPPLCGAHGSAIIWDVTPEDFQDILRDYIKDRLKADFDNNKTRFSRDTGIPRTELTNFCNKQKGANATLEWIVLVSATVGPALSKLLEKIADRVQAFENRSGRGVTLTTETARAHVRAEDAGETKAAIASVKRDARSRRGGQHRPDQSTRKGRPSPHS